MPHLFPLMFARIYLIRALEKVLFLTLWTFEKKCFGGQHMFVQLLVKERNVLLDEILCQYPSVIKATYFVNVLHRGIWNLSDYFRSFFTYLTFLLYFWYWENLWHFQYMSFNKRAHFFLKLNSFHDFERIFSSPSIN